MKKSSIFIMAIIAFFVVLILSTFAPSETPAADKWATGVTIRFFCGGDPGDAFASIVYRGAKAAEADLGPKVEYVFSGWNFQRLLNSLREAIAVKPDGIAFMGHPGNDAVMPLAEEASKAGILMMYQNVDVPKVRARFGGGYVGAILEPQGRALAHEAITALGLKKGDRALVITNWGLPGRFIREGAVADAFAEAGLIVDKMQSIDGMMANPNLLTAPLTAAFLRNPDTKVIVYNGGQVLGAAEIYMKAIGKKPGEVYNIGFDTSAAVIDAFKKGYAQLTSDQQPFLQGYLPILSLCLTKKYGFGPIFVDTGHGIVNQKNYQAVAELAIAGYR
jgi:simple sugar transport system substrate-binding protein